MSETEQKKATSSKRGGETANALPMVGPDMVARIGQSAMQGLSEQQQQMNAFVTHRLEEVARLQQKLAECKTPPDVFSAFSDFTQTAIRDYGEQAGEMQRNMSVLMWKGMVRSETEQEEK